MIIAKHYVIVAMSLLCCFYIHSKSKPVTSQKRAVAPHVAPQNIVATSQLSNDVDKLVETIFSKPDTVKDIESVRSEIYQQLAEVLQAILDKKNTLPVSIHLTKMKNLLTSLDSDNKLTKNPELQAYFNKATHMKPESRSPFKRTLPQEIQNDLYAKEIYETLHFVIKNKDKQNVWDSPFWMQADTTYHFKRIINRLLPADSQLHSIETMISRINSK